MQAALTEDRGNSGGAGGGNRKHRKPRRREEEEDEFVCECGVCLNEERRREIVDDEMWVV